MEDVIKMKKLELQWRTPCLFFNQFTVITSNIKHIMTQISPFLSGVSRLHIFTSISLLEEEIIFPFLLSVRLNEATPGINNKTMLSYFCHVNKIMLISKLNVL